MKKLFTVVPVFVLALCMFTSPGAASASSPEKPAGKAFMGVDYSVITLDDAHRLGLGSTDGVMVTRLVPGSPADSCGIRINDVIVSIDTVPIVNSQVFRTTLAGYRSGDLARIEYIRGKASHVVELKFASVPAPLQDGKLSWTDTKAIQISELLDMIDLNNKSMGCIAIADSERILVTRALGYKSIQADSKLPANPDTRYRIGSITKTFTAVMIFQLIEAGKLSMDSTLDAWFPAGKPAEMSKSSG